MKTCMKIKNGLKLPSVFLEISSKFEIEMFVKKSLNPVHFFFGLKKYNLWEILYFIQVPIIQTNIFMSF